ncbi:unnamed protein product [Ectocarpus sp. CCAP 1310/34]|nr:unnamed protein product [Ectocarpus sp. CCAP 1310/34]
MHGAPLRLHQVARSLSRAPPTESEADPGERHCQKKGQQDTAPTFCKLRRPHPMAQTDREALGAFYNATGGPNWEHNNNWNADADPSEWLGIETNDQGRVVRLSLGSNNLQGISRFSL